MTRTVDLIDRLVVTTTPVKRLAPPWMRAGTWLLLALVVILALAALHGVRPDFAERIFVARINRLHNSMRRTVANPIHGPGYHVGRSLEDSLNAAVW